jgi:hypothetical protein
MGVVISKHVKYGSLIFTDKAIIFLQFSEFEQYKFSSSLLGQVGSIKDGIEQAGAISLARSLSKEISEKTLKEAMDVVKEITIIYKNQIKRINLIPWRKGMQIFCVDGTKMSFSLWLTKQVYQSLKSNIEHYAEIK